MSAAAASSIADLDVNAGLAHHVQTSQIRAELLRDREGLEMAYTGFRYFRDGGKGHRLSELQHPA